MLLMVAIWGARFDNYWCRWTWAGLCGFFLPSFPFLPLVNSLIECKWYSPCFPHFRGGNMTMSGQSTESIPGSSKWLAQHWACQLSESLGRGTMLARPKPGAAGEHLSLHEKSLPKDEAGKGKQKKRLREPKSWWCPFIPWIQQLWL